MGNDIREEVIAIHDSMVGSEAASEFLEPELENTDVAAGDQRERRYACDSVFSGVEEFMLFNAAYRGLSEARTTTLPAVITSAESLTEAFFAKYREFSGQADFETRCRPLLDLFKLQIVFAGLTYE